MDRFWWRQLGMGLWGSCAALILIFVTPVHAQLAPDRIALCASCHGADGNSPNGEFPKLAKLQVGYFVRQMEDYKKGKRKSSVMQGIVAAIDEKEFQAFAQHFNQQNPPAPGQGDAKLLARGKEIFYEGIVGSAVPACSGCHKDDGTGTNRYPRLAGQHPEYLIQQMLSYKSGARDNDDRGLMRTVAQRMNEAEIKAVSQYIVTLKGDEE
ncbi:MAG: cytochrome c4 [Burkholderiaceae bacterium]|nr:cytochrome c4 [Burkholderiaceae bacterium]